MAVTRGRLTLRAARLLAWVYGVASVSSSPVAIADTPCIPAASVSGGEELVRDVESELVAHGIDVRSPAKCPHTRVEIERDDEQIVLDLTDPAGRTIRRRVSRIGEAVTVIESWARQDMNADLLAGFDVSSRMVAMPEATTSRVPAGSPDATSLKTRGVEVRVERSPLTVSLLGDLGFDRRATWVGATMTACAPVRRTCIGGTGHLRTAAGGTLFDAAALATIDVPLRVRRLTVIPSIGIGAGRDGSSMQEGMQNQVNSGWGFRAEMRLAATYPLSRWMFVDVMVGLVGARVTTDGQNNQDGEDASATELAPMFELGAGLRVGAP